MYNNSLKLSNQEKQMSGKPVKIHESVHVMLEEIINSGYQHKGMPHKKPSKASIVTELVSKLHKKECK